MRVRLPFLIGLVATVLLVLAGATVLLTARTADDERERRAEARLAVAESYAAALDDWARDLRSGVQRAATTLEPWDPDQNRRNVGDRLVEAAGRAVPGAEALLVVDPDGRVAAATQERAAAAGRERDDETVRAALGGEVALSPITEDPAVREPEVRVAAPLHDASGRTVAAVVAVLPLEGSQLVGLLNGLPKPGASTLAITDPSGRVLEPGPLPESVPVLGPAVAHPVAQAADAPWAGSFQGEADVPSFGAAAGFAEGWAVVLVEELAAFERGLLGPALAAAAPAFGLAALATALIGFVLRELRRARQEAERTRRAMVAVTGHELRTPLTVVKGLIGTLHRRGARVSETQRAQLLDTAMQHTQRLELLIERLITVGQLTTGRAPSVSPTTVDVAEVARGAVEHQRLLAPLHEVELHADGPAPAVADRKALDQVLRHLLDNAVRYSPDGGEVRVVVAPGRRRVEVAVEDRGIGLPADPSRLFDAFVQGQDVDTRVEDEGGVGAGLFISRRLLDQMGATLTAENRDAGGARLVVSLRAAREETPATRTPPADASTGDETSA